MSVLNDFIQENKPFDVIKTDKKKAQLQISYLVKELFRIAEILELFMPETSKKIKEAIQQNKKPENLFPRK